MMRKNYWNYKLKNMMVIFLSAAVSFSSAAGMSLKSYAADEQQENEEETNDSSENGDAGDNNDAEENNEAGDNNDAAENNNNNENNENAEENASNDEADDNESDTNGNDAGEENESDEAGNSDETDNSTSNNDDNNLGDETENNENAQSEENNGTPESASSAPVEPTKPEIEGELDNDKIRQYNQEAENYNQQVDDYNKAVDEEYEQALIDTEKKNEEIEQNNQEQLARAAEVESENAQLQAQYEEELTQYNKDLVIEGKILALGYSSVEQYNATMIKANNEANASVPKNSDENAVFSMANSYVIEEAEIKSGNAVPVHIEHLFPEVNLYYTEDFEIDENDIITFYSAAVQLESTEPGYASFYMNTDESHLMGFWSQYSICEAAANFSEYIINCGASHRVSFKDGTLYPSDIPEIYMTYNYLWYPLKNNYKTYNVPKEPTLNLIDFTPNIMEKLAAPSKRSYLDHISLMDLLAEPEIEVTPEPEPEVIPEITPVIPVVPTITPVVPEVPAPAAPADETPSDGTPDAADDAAPAEDAVTTAPAPAAITIEEAPAPLAAVPEQGAVLGASRDTNKAAVLGARRASTEDTTNAPIRVMFILLAGFTAITVIRKSGKRTLLK
ncbi:hypothetical protein SAMN02910276_01016 [Butyrivibrio sp. Su6]|uniref:hypothetical protein n=1 Tax=Butyrivibrio sp. Su6 TaxID=1520810 RepID=UPI00089EA9B1|nr:hypothetical protein [Butyrivibrio sp. Su6]SEF77170.1 hypothetical protein SAMN02910276_01016 [Butyrivibrio sp. Su6]